MKKKKTMAAETEASISGSSSEEEEEEEGPLGRGLGAENDEDSDEEMLGSGGGRGGKGTRTGAIFVLENASLEVGKVGKTLQLLNCDDHNNFLRKKRKDPDFLSRRGQRIEEELRIPVVGFSLKCILDIVHILGKHHCKSRGLPLAVAQIAIAHHSNLSKFVKSKCHKAPW